ncbi:hypothetical protein BH11BAC1_BH11BAC1_16480 [soil metagenome]
MEIQTSHYYAKNERNEILFRLDLSDIGAFPSLKFSCSIDIDFNRNADLRKALEGICSSATAPEKKATLLQQVVREIIRIEEVDKMHFHERESTSEFRDELEGFLDFVVAQESFRQFRPFSKSKNPHFFNLLKNKFASPPQLLNLAEVDKDCYESLIKGHENLEEEYVDRYSVTATFFTTAVKHKSMCYEFYIMKTDKVDMIFFISINILN